MCDKICQTTTFRGGGYHNSQIKNFKFLLRCLFVPILIFKFLGIIKSHNKKIKAYKQIVAIFPEFKRANLESLGDYKEALLCKKHLSFLLGNAFIKAHKQIFTGGYFRLYSFINEARKEYNEFSNLKLKLRAFENPIIIENFSLHTLKFIFENLEKINQWLDSDLFEKEFSHFQRKPLINPHQCDYKNIPALCAWELNLPLPPLYDLILISGSRSGHNAILNFFEQCEAKRAKDHLPIDLKIIYTHFYDFLLDSNHTNFFKILPFIQYAGSKYSIKEYKSYCEFFIHKSPCLVQVRDPFIKLLLANNRWNKPNAVYRFTLKDDLNAILDRIYYAWSGQNSLENALNYLCSLEFLRQASAIKGLNCISDIHFVDTDNELMPNNAFETMKKLALKYKLNPPKDRDFFEGLIEENLFALLPLTLSLNYQDVLTYLNKEDLQALPKYRNSWDKTKFKVDLLITAYQFMKLSKNQRDYIDISEQILGQKNWLYEGSDIRIYANKNEYKCYFDELLCEAAKKYFKYFQKELMKRNEIEKAKRFSIEDILEYLNQNSILKFKLKTILDQELESIKKMRPDIVDTWIYYKKFEKSFNRE